MKVILTGGKGFIGKELQRQLYALNIAFDVFEDNLDNFSHIQGSYEYVIHLAAKLKPAQNIFSLYETNVLGTQKVVDYCIKNKANLIFLSTSGVYGEESSGIAKAEDTECFPVDPYPISKLLAEKICEKAFLESQLNCNILRLFNVYGNEQREKFLIPDIIYSLKHSAVLTLKTPNALRDFINVKDVVRSIVASFYLTGFNIINIGSGQAISILDLIKRIEKIIGKK